MNPVWATVFAGIGGGVIGVMGTGLQVVKDLATAAQARRLTTQSEQRAAYIELMKRADALTHLVESQAETNYRAADVLESQLLLRDALTQALFWAPADTADAAAAFVRSREEDPAARFGTDSEREAFTRLARRDVT